MKLTVLTDNCAGRSCLAEHGLSYLIEHKGFKLLLDTGHSDVFIKNSEILGIDLDKEIDTVVLSHGHWDHGDGLPFLQGKKLICHPLSFIKRYRRIDHTFLGIKMSKSEVMSRYDLQTTVAPLEITKDIFFLGEIPRKNDFESKVTSFIDANGDPDFVLDDSALVFIDGNEIIVVSGCSHSGICNIVDYAMQFTGINKVKAVIGGFHLKHDDELTHRTVDYLKSLNIKTIAPSHCTELDALCAFKRDFKFTQLRTGMTIDI